MNHLHCCPSTRHRANAVTGLPGFLNLFLDELPTGLHHRPPFGSVNVSETPTSYDIEVSIPGFDKGDFKVQLDGKLLHISAEKTSETTTDNDRRYIRREFKQSTTFKRTFTVPDNANATAIAAQYNNGILVVSIPKKVAAEKPVQHIEVQ